MSSDEVLDESANQVRSLQHCEMPCPLHDMKVVLFDSKVVSDITTTGNGEDTIETPTDHRHGNRTGRDSIFPSV